jgi:hypothetical protein
MKTLEADFTGKGEVSGVRFIQLYRFEDLCLYSRSDNCWEVIRIRHQKAGIRKFKDKEIFYEEKEYYPKGEDWGTYEWACNSLDRGIDRFNEQAKTLGYEVVLTPDMI